LFFVRGNCFRGVWAALFAAIDAPSAAEKCASSGELRPATDFYSATGTWFTVFFFILLFSKRTS